MRQLSFCVLVGKKKLSEGSNKGAYLRRGQAVYENSMALCCGVTINVIRGVVMITCLGGCNHDDDDGILTQTGPLTGRAAAEKKWGFVVYHVRSGN